MWKHSISGLGNWTCGRLSSRASWARRQKLATVSTVASGSTGEDGQELLLVPGTPISELLEAYGFGGEFVDLSWVWPKREDLRASTDWIVVHRAGSEALGLTRAEDIVNALIDKKYGWGGKVAYTFIVEQSGRIVQLAPIMNRTNHAANRNADAIGVAFAGDFRSEVPSKAMYLAGGCLLKALRTKFPMRIDKIQRHNKVPGGTRFPQKQCPGKMFSIERLRAVSI